jgi:hypothetical protein
MSGLVRFAGWFVSACSSIPCASLAFAYHWAATLCLEGCQAMNDIVPDGRRGRAPVPAASIEALYRHEASRLLRFFSRGTQHEAEAQDLNIFNAKPDRIRSSSAFVPAFDSTNYSAIGRYVGFTVEKSW